MWISLYAIFAGVAACPDWAILAAFALLVLGV